MDLVKLMIERAVYPLMERRRGNRIRPYLRELTASEALPPDELAALQRRRLEALLDVCAREVPAYRFLGAEGVSPLIRFADIPPLTRAALRADPDAFLAASARPETLTPGMSGGTTDDAPVRFYLDRRAVEHYEAARWRGLSWWGITPGSRSVMVWGAPVEWELSKQAAYRRREKWLKNRVMIPAHDLSRAALPGHIALLDRYRPEYLYGYASALYALANLMRQTGLRPKHAPRIVLSTSEMLFDFQRTLIAEVFGCPVVNEYGAKDAGILAYECPEGQMHITCENALLEVLDPQTLRPLPPGETGVLAVTDLHNFSMPRLRYLLGDMASLSAKRCRCGRTLPLLDALEGRLVDILVTRDDRLVHGNVLVHLSNTHGAVERFQIVQHTPELATLRIVPAEGSHADDMEGFIRQVRALLPGTQVAVELVSDIAPSASGKRRYAIREFDLPGAP
ncbi:MAG: phenylacetate--CoA ligase family protein [Oscillospiraceae bacterium]|jgi:phenylacetate-CoA ligase|nr:phenylacetate--CoA ligase family protein [Oscillospiraceae bacterium]